jgi:2,3-bisphosphoglycerate-dependent phosphoglycerate mutase
LEESDDRHPKHDPRYAHLPSDVLPKTESLKLTVDRVLPYWYDRICPQILSGKDVIVVAHGNSLRAIVKHLTQMGEKEIIGYNIPTAVPLVFEFDQDFKPKKHYFLLDEKELKERIAAVANQGKVKH